MGKTALEKSHSKSSNFKLTLICLLTLIGISVFWVGLGLTVLEIQKVFGLILLIAGGAVSLLCFTLIRAFKR